MIVGENWYKCLFERLTTFFTVWVKERLELILLVNSPKAWVDKDFRTDVVHREFASGFLYPVILQESVALYSRQYSGKVSGLGWPCLQGFLNALGIVRNDRKISAGRLIRFTTPLFPIAQCAQGNVIAGGKFLLGQSEGTAQSLNAWYPLHAGEVGLCKRLGVGITQSGCCDRLVTQRRGWLHHYFFLGAIRVDPYQGAVTLHSDESRCLAHGVLLCVLK